MEDITNPTGLPSKATTSTGRMMEPNGATAPSSRKNHPKFLIEDRILSGNPWEHFSLTPSNWNKVFPDIYLLNPEIWDALADITVFGWLNLSVQKSLRIERNSSIPTTQEKIEIILDGMQYGDGVYGGTLWPYDAYPPGQKTVTRTVTQTFEIYPGFQYESNVWNDASQWFVSYGNYVLEETVTIEDPGNPCNLGVRAKHIDRTDMVLVGAVDAVESSLLFDVIPAFETTTILVPEYAGMVGLEWGQQWCSNQSQPYDIYVQYGELKIGNFETPIGSFILNPQDLSINSSLSIDMGFLTIGTFSISQFAAPPVIYPIVMPYTVDSFEGLETDWAQIKSETVSIDWSEDPYSNHIYRFDQFPLEQSDFWQSAPTPLVSETIYTPAVITLEPSDYVWLYSSSLYDAGDQWFFAGTPKIEGTIQQVPHYEVVNLCNVAANWTTGTILSLVKSEIDLPPTVLPLFDLYPIIGSVSNGSNWKLLLETTEGITVLPPTTMFWSDVLGAGDPGKRSQGISLETGLTNLYLEFIIQPQIASKLRSVTLMLENKVLKASSFGDPLDFSDPGCFGFRFSVPLRFPSGASSTDENLAILEFFPNLIDSVAKFDGDYLGLPIQVGRDAPPPLLPPSLFNPGDVTEETLRDLLGRVIEHVDRLDNDLLNLEEIGDKHYEHHQTVLSDRWVIQHGLNKEPSVTVIMDDNLAAIADLDYSIPNIVIVIFDKPTTGKATCN